MSERLNFHGVMESGSDVIRSPTCTLSLIPPVFSRPGVSGGTFCQDNRAWNFCKASQPPWDPTGSKSETDVFRLPLSKDDPQPLSEGASKEDLAAEEPLDDYIEPESPLPDDLVDLLVEGSATFFAITCSQA